MLFDDGEEIFTLTTMVVDGQYFVPCGCKSEGTFVVQYTNVVKDVGFSIGECRDCGATWNDNVWEAQF